MVAALPEGEKNSICHNSNTVASLRKTWMKVTNKSFDVNPYLGNGRCYVDDLVEAQREGTLQVVKKIIKEQL